MKKWRFLDTQAHPGAWNMAVDEAILKTHERGLTLPTLRVFQWSPPALSLGRLQETQDIDFEKCRELGIDVVRRPTGAGAVLHKEELTYSVVVSEKDGFPVSLRESFQLINRGLAAACKILGIEIAFITAPRRNKSALCFLSSGLTDLTFEGKKLIGSVWMREGHTILQHGSLVILQEPELLFSIFRFPSEEIKEKALKEFGEKTTSFKEIFGGLTWQDVRKALFEGFQDALKIEFSEITRLLVEEEITEAKKLMAKYETVRGGG